MLPFVDNSFDAIFSLDVLEHVNDRMASAKEIARVLKPGGILYIALPFLQAVHGCPHHYFNAIRAGLQELFKGFLESEAHIVPRSGHPMATIHQIIDIYGKNLPDPTAKNFRNLTVRQILEFHQEQWITMPEFEELSEEGQWLIASTTQAVFRKPESSVTEAAAMGWFKADQLPGFGKTQPVCETTKLSLDETMGPMRGSAWRWVQSGARRANRIFRSGAPNHLPVKSRLVDRLVARIFAWLWRFDAGDYLNENPDVREAGMAPMDHWVKYGYLEQRRLR